MNGYSKTIFILVLAVIGCSPKESSRALTMTLPEPDEIVIYSLDHLSADRPSPIADNEKFGGYPAWGKVEVTNAKQRKEVKKLFEYSLNPEKPAIAACFWPRHGIRWTSGSETKHYIICFECGSYQSYGDGDRQGGPIGPDAQMLFDKLLTDANVKLAPKDKTSGD